MDERRFRMIYVPLTPAYFNEEEPSWMDEPELDPPRGFRWCDRTYWEVASFSETTVLWKRLCVSESADGK